MKIIILHLSDLHFKESGNIFSNRINNLVDAVKNKTLSSKQIFVLISGDLVYSGKKEEFDEVNKLLTLLESKLQEKNPSLLIEYIFSAGNHDCDFSDNDAIEVRTLILNSIIENPDKCTDNLVSQVTKVQDNYFDFVNTFSSTKNINNEVSNKLLTKYEYDIDGYKITFNSYNSAWMSSKREKQSRMIFPLKLIQQDKISDEQSNLKVSLFHHPYHWLEHQNIREFKEFVKENSDFIFTGHEHSVTASGEDDFINNSNVIHIEAGTIQDSHNEQESKFNLLTYDIKNNKKDLTVFEWKNNDFEKIIEKEINGGLNNDKAIFKFKSTYYEKISELGIKVNHPRKENVILSNLFIYPDVKQLNVSKNITKKFSKMSSEELMHQDVIGLNIIYGGDNAGKSALLKIFQTTLLKEKNFVPINICSKDFKNNISNESIEKIIRQAFKRQYITNDYVFKEYDKLDRNRVVLLIEDFHKSNGNNEYKTLIIEAFLKLTYSNIVITANDLLKFEATAETELAKKLEIFNHYSIQEFGHRLRDKLITKWIRLGQEYDIENIDLSNLRREIAAHITQTVGFNIVPSYPIYLLTLLQAMEINDSSLDKSSFGHYYNFLILQYLNAEKKLENKDLNTIYTYCSELAFYTFSSKKYEYTYSELEEFDSNYKVKKDFFPSFSILDKLIKSTILTEQDGKYKFAQKYIYYYFVAYYFSKHIDAANITSIIEAMTKRLYRTEFANILMFILHLAPKTDIINMLKNEALTIFSEVDEFTFAKTELTNINSCIKFDVDTSLKFENRTIEESREIEIKKEERNSEVVSANIYFDDRDEADYNEEIQQLDFFKRLNLAFKVMEILGEITKNYSGSLEGNIKSELVQLVYSIGLKSLKIFILLFEEHHQQLVSDIKNIIIKKNKITSDKIDEAVYGVIFGLASTISIDIVKKIAKAIGTKDLNHLYKRFSDENEANLAYLVIKMAINLDFSGGLNEKEIVNAYKQLKNERNMLPNSTIRNLVLEHLYMFETSIAKKTSICQRLDIHSKDSQRKLIQKSL